MMKLYFGRYIEDERSIECKQISMAEFVETAASSGSHTLYINTFPYTEPHDDNDLGLFFEGGVLVGFGTTNGIDKPIIREVSMAFDAHLGEPGLNAGVWQAEIEGILMSYS